MSRQIHPEVSEIAKTKIPAKTGPYLSSFRCSLFKVFQSASRRNRKIDTGIQQLRHRLQYYQIEGLLHNIFDLRKAG
jgi:hypothetical protein